MATDRQESGRRKTVAVASFGGWAVDAFDYQLFGLALPLLLVSWHLSSQDAGWIITTALIGAALGGSLGGMLADRWGRVPVLQLSILVFATATFLCAFITTPGQLVVLKGVQGLGFGAEWSVGAVLLAEVAPAKRRGTFLGVMQSAWAVGWAGAVVVYLVATAVLPADIAWRAMFGFGLLPALLVLWLRRRLGGHDVPLSVPPPTEEAFADRSDLRRRLVLTTIIGLGAHGGYHSLFTWLPTLLRTDRGYSPALVSATLLLMTLGFAAGCIMAGRTADRIGRRPTIALFACGSVLAALLFTLINAGPTIALLLALPVGFAAGGTPAVLGSWFSELFPARVRGASVGVAYNGGRLAAAFLPGLIGWASGFLPLSVMIGLVAAGSYSLVVLVLPFLPETRGASLTAGMRP